MKTNWKNVQTGETATLTKLESGIIYATFWLYNKPIASATFFSTIEAKAYFAWNAGWS